MITLDVKAVFITYNNLLIYHFVCEMCGLL